MKNVLLFILTILILTSNLISQQEDNKVTYDVSFGMKTLVYHTYRFTENVKVTRVFEDSTVNKYNKKITYWYNVFVPADKDGNGFLKLEISTDSMKYEFDSPKKKISYFTQDFEAPMPITDLDFLMSFLSNNQNFEFTYSPYGNVAKVGGEKLLDERKIHSKIEDSKKRDFLLKALSDETLIFKFDVTKGVYPTFDVDNDTTWTSEMRMSINSTPINGEVTNKFIGYKNGEYHIETELDSLSLISPNDNYYFSDLDKYGTIENILSTGNMKTDLYTGGTVKYVRANLKSLVEGKISGLKYKEIIETTYTWDLLKRFSF